MKKTLPILIAIILIFLCGTLGYYLIEDGWSLFDAFYMTAISITTVGYSETRPLSQTGRVFTVVLIFTGLGTAAVFATTLAKAFLENNLKTLFGANQMKKRVNQLENHYIICGYGDIGSAISLTLDEHGIPFVIVEEDEEKFGFAVQHNFLAIRGKATYDATLFQSGIQKARGMVICLGDDSENLYVTLAAREINPELQIIVRGYKSQGERRMKRAGANSVVYPLKLGGEQVARLIINQFEEKYRSDSNISDEVMGYSLRKYSHYSAAPGSIESISAAHRGGLVVKLCKKNGNIIEYPNPELPVERDDTLLILLPSNAEGSDEIISETLIWNDDLILGVPEIDEEHKQLVDLINIFLDALSRNKEKEVLSLTFENLLEYTCIHFRNEEALFDKRGYPEAEAHKLEHERLTDKVRELNREKKYVFSDSIADFLKSWIANHILEQDKAFAYYLNKDDNL
jgi:hemerythrin-like metal-binding protein